MQLKKDVKEKIILQLVVEAVKKHGPAMGRAAESLDKLFRAAVTKQVQAAVPEVPPSRWADLIQAGVMTRFSSMENIVYLPIPGRADGAYASYGVGHVSGGCGEIAASLFWQLRLRMEDQGWSKFLRYVATEKQYGNYIVKWKMSYSDLPGMSSMFSIDMRPEQPSAWSQDAWPLHAQAVALNEKFLRVLHEAKAFYDDLQIIFDGIRTAKQLIDQFPAAAKLLPPPPPPRQALAPKDLIERANHILETGIPN